jgi:hypothetical protein
MVIVLPCIIAAALAIPVPVPGDIITKLSTTKLEAIDRWHYDVGAPLLTTPILK